MVLNMPTIKTKLDEATYASLVRRRKAAGLPSVSALFLRNCGVLTDQSEASQIVDRALARAKERPRESKFRLRNLFDDQQWRKFSKSARLRAGKIFLDEFGSAIHGIRAAHKSSSNHQFYIRA